MKNNIGESYSNFYSGKYHAALGQKDYKKALNFSIKGYLISCDIADELLEKAFFTMISEAINLLSKKELHSDNNEKRDYLCSFCGRNASETKIVSGAKGTICKICVRELNEHFIKEEKGI